MKTEPKKDRLSFTARFDFSGGRSFFKGFSPNRIDVKYRVLMMNPKDNHFWTMKGMEEPMTLDEIDEVIKERYGGSLCGEEFAFEVFDNSGKRKLYATKFNAQEKIPPDGYASDKWVITSFSWAFELPDDLKKILNI